MASTQLVAFTEGFDESDPMQIGDGEYHTLIPIIHGHPGKVVVQVLNSEDTYAHYRTLSFRKTKDWRLKGPLQYRVQVRNAGCDLDDGTTGL